MTDIMIDPQSSDKGTLRRIAQNAEKGILQISDSYLILLKDTESLSEFYMKLKTLF